MLASCMKTAILNHRGVAFSAFSARVGELALEPAAQARRVERAGNALHLCSLPECNQGRNAANGKLSGDLSVRIGIELREAQLSLVLLGGLRKHRRKRLARATPLSPEIDDDRQIVARDERREGLSGEARRFSAQNGRVAAPALRLLREPVFWNAIDLCALRTHDMHSRTQEFAARSGSSPPARSSADRSSNPPTWVSPM